MGFEASKNRSYVDVDRAPVYFKCAAQSRPEEFKFDAKKLQNRVQTTPKMDPKTIQNRCLGENRKKCVETPPGGTLLGSQVEPKLGLETVKMGLEAPQNRSQKES